MIFKTARYLILGLGVGLSLGAQEPTLALGLKMGAGLGASGNEEQMSNLSLHLALAGQYRLDSRSSLIGELKYVYFRAEEWENPVFPYSRAQSYYFEDGGKGWSSRQVSIDLRKNELDGLALSLGYRRAIGNTKWSWQAGLNLYSLKSQDQTIIHVGLFEDEEDFDYFVGPDSDYWNYWIVGDEHRNWLEQRGKNSLKPGVFAGIHGKIGENMFVEANLLTIGHDQVFFMPHAYTGKPDALESYSRNKAVLEFSAGFRF